MINLGAVIIGEEKRIDWNAIQSEYIGGMSIRKLAGKYGLSKDQVAKRSKSGRWQEARLKAKDKAATKAIQKAAEASSDNAVRLQEARAVAIAKVKAALDAMPEGSGSHVRRQINDGKTGLPITMDYDLPALVQALAKLTEETTRATSEDKNAPVYELLRRLDGESGV